MVSSNNWYSHGGKLTGKLMVECRCPVVLCGDGRTIGETRTAWLWQIDDDDLSMDKECIELTTMSEEPENKMEYVRLGNSGLKVSKIILGCMSYGSAEWQDWVSP